MFDLYDIQLYLVSQGLIFKDKDKIRYEIYKEMWNKFDHLNRNFEDVIHEYKIDITR